MGRLNILLSNLMIRQKIWIGFSIVLVILAVISISALRSLSGVNGSVTTVVRENQPLVINSMQLADELAQANSFLGFYLLSHEETHKASFIQMSDKVKTSLQALKNIAPSKLTDEVIQIEKDLSEYFEYSQKMLKLPGNRTGNFPGFAYAAANLNPKATVCLAALAEMIVSEEEQEGGVERKELLNNIQNLRYAFTSMMNELRVYLNSTSDATLVNLETNRERVDTEFNKLLENSDLYTFEQEEGVEVLKENIQAFTDNLENVIKIQSSDKKRMDAYWIRNKLGPLVENITAELDQLVSSQQQDIQTNSQELLETVDTSQNIVSILLATGLGIGVLVAFVISQMITLELNETVDAMQDVASGDGDLSRRLKVKGKDEISQLSSAFNEFAAKVAATVSEVAASANNLADASTSLEQETSKTAIAMDEQQCQISDVASSMTRLTTQVEAVVSTTQDAATMATEANNTGNEGRLVVAENISAVQQLSRDINEASLVIGELEKNSSEIGSVLDVIQGIAEQTNLLALNAAIEAARAGEQGRGFAVVADEVRTLASRTQQSTSEIKQIIERIQTGSKEAVTSMSHGHEQVKCSVDNAHKSGESLEKISHSVSDINDMNDNIAQAANEQSILTGQVHQTVKNIATVANETSRAAENMASTSLNVKKLTEALQNTIGQFKV